jgi:hypothetical protein
MPRRCSVCTHPEVEKINAALVAGDSSFLAIAALFGVSDSALRRHKKNHLPATLARAQDAAEVAQADDLLGQVKELRDKAYGILLKAEAAGELRTALAAIREARGCLELLARLLGELQEQPVINVLLSPQWVTIRTVLLHALTPFPEARVAAAAALLEVDSERGR